MAKPFNIYKIKIDTSKTKEEREYEGVREWTDIFRQNPHRAVSTWFEYDGLTWYQDMCLYLMFKSSVFFAIACRGWAKSYIIGWFLILWGTLFPRSRMVISSGTKGQSRLIVTQKIMGEIYNNYPKVRQEIDLKNCNLGMNDTCVKFYNGSEIVVVTGSDNSRGKIK